MLFDDLLFEVLDGDELFGYENEDARTYIGSLHIENEKLIFNGNVIGQISNKKTFIKLRNVIAKDLLKRR